MLTDEYTDDGLNDRYWEKGVSMNDNWMPGKINRSSSYRTRRVSVYDFEKNN